MYRVLIVEDEMLVRLGLKNSIEWERFDMEIIADVSDGEAAWEIYTNNRPDLIITDLKMPVMGGMELIERIRKNDSDTVIVILSCLEEFDLVLKAMSLGVLDYIPKLTMTEEETERILKKAQLELNKHKKSEPVEPVLTNNKIIDREKLLKDFVFYNIYSAKEFEANALKLKLNISPARLVLCLLEIDHYEVLQSRFKDEKGQLIKLSMLNILDELMANCGRGEAFYDDDNHYILIFSFEDIRSEQALQQVLYDVLNNIKSVIATFFNTTVSFGISSVQKGYDSIGKMYKEAAKALEQKFIMGSGIFSVVESLDLKDKFLNRIEALRSMQKLLRQMDAGSAREYSKKIDEIQNISTLEKGLVQQLFCQLLQWIPSYIHFKGENAGALIVASSNKISKCGTLDDIIEAYSMFVSEITENAIKNRALSREVAEAVKFIRINYCKDINLQQVADYVKLSPAYLSSLFKKELQVSFIEYLNELRVDKAKKLLLETYLKSYEIAEKTGFSENTYFSKVFKKVTGVSPNEFRKQWMKEWDGEIENEDN